MQRVVLQKGKGHRVEGGHPWVYGNELESIQTAILDGEIVKVYNFKGQFVGRGYYNERSQIRVRLLTRNTDEQIDETFFRNRILQCAAYRRELGFTKNYRLVFG
ncbi:MAG: rRNA large subunit methyltransferase I, partial [Chitinophagales bacterium]